MSEKGGHTPRPDRTPVVIYEVHVHVHGLQLGGSDSGIAAKLEQIIAALAASATREQASAVQEGRIMATLDELVTAVAAESTVEDSIITLLRQVKAMLDAGGLSAADQAKVDAVFAQVTSNTTKVTDAVTENTPAAPAP